MPLLEEHLCLLVGQVFAVVAPTGGLGSAANARSTVGVVPTLVVPVLPRSLDSSSDRPDTKALQAGIVLQAGVGLAVATTDVLPVDKGISSGDLLLVDVVAALEDFSNRAPIAVCCLGSDSHLRSNGKQCLQCLPGCHSIGGLGGLRGIDAGKTHSGLLCTVSDRDGVAVPN